MSQSMDRLARARTAADMPTLPRPLTALARKLVFR